MKKIVCSNLNIYGSDKKYFIPKGSEIEFIIEDGKSNKIVFDGEVIEFDHNVLPLIATY